MLSPSHHELLETATRYQRDMLTFLQDLVRIPSVNGRETEKRVAERIGEEAKRLNFSSKYVAKDKKRPNVLVTLGKGQNGFALIGHMDTVSEGTRERWNHPPFSAEIQADRLFGRGAADNKAGIVCGFFAMVLLRELGLLDLTSTKVILAGVVDEEAGASSELGVRYLLDVGALPVTGAIYSYASNVVCIGHRGLLRLELTTHGQAVHAGLLEWHLHKIGSNAVTALSDTLIQLEKLRVDAPMSPGFEKLGCTITPGTIMRGGSYESVVPDEACAVVDIRLMPGQDEDFLIKKVKHIIENVERSRPGIRIEWRTKVNIPGASIPIDHPLTTIAQKHAKIFTGKHWRAEGAGPANEGYMLINAGIPTLCGFGPTGGNPHAADEWVSIKSLPVTAAVYAAIICAYLDLIHKGENHVTYGSRSMG